MKKRSQKSVVTTTTQTERTVRTEEDLLTPAEEKAVRMVHGLAEGPEHELQFGLGANEEALAKLASLEQFLVGHRQGQARQLDGIFEMSVGHDEG